MSAGKGISRVHLVHLIIILGLFFMGLPDSTGQPPNLEHKIMKDLSEKVKSVDPNEKVKVIIILKKPAERSQSQAARSSVRKDILAKGGKVRREYSIFEGMAAEIPASKVKALANNPNVELIEYDHPVRALINDSIPLINADDVWNEIQLGQNVTGIGQTVCVIDSGVNYSNSFFGGELGPNYTVIGGYDFVNNDADPMDDNRHGTHVAGIVASTNSIYRGVAPGAKIVAIKVLGASGLGNSNDIIAGIEWCVDNATLYNISVISMSLGVLYTNYSTYCDSNFSSYTTAINSAVAKNISVVVATGNDNIYSGVGSPACIQNATRVTATNKTDGFADFANRGGQFNDILAAPGVNIWSAHWQNDNYILRLSGTSMATPHVSGLIALLNQRYKASSGVNPTPDYLFSVMNTTGVSLYDNETDRNYSRIDALAAYNLVVNTTPPTTTASPTGGLYSSEVIVTLTADENATIYYFLNDSSEITSSSIKGWRVYSSQIGITTNTTLMFYAVDSAGNNESVQNETYNISYLYPHEFYDDFEGDKGWGIYEEMVNITCYGNGSIGEVTRSTDEALNSSYGLRVWANKNDTNKSNHVIGSNKLSDKGRGGRWLYELYAYIDPANNDTGQTGPEFSVQNTREVNAGVFNLTIAGFQYIANR